MSLPVAGLMDSMAMRVRDPDYSDASLARARAW